MNRSPFVSVVMPAYNHAPFVVAAIQSVLDQDFGDLELLVGDDGSQDDTLAAARSVRDSRVQVFDFGVNRGAAVVHNDLVARATGKYVAVLNSDDKWLPGKLSKQVAVLEENQSLAACFGRARFIGRDNEAIRKQDLAFGSVFDVDNRSRGAWLRHFFHRGNCICHPTLLIRRQVYQELGPYDNRLRQLPDFDMWIRLVKRHSLFICDEDFIEFRILPGENASSDTGVNAYRTYNEHYFIARRFFEGVSPDLLREGFGDLLSRAEIPSEIHAEIEKAMLFLHPVPNLGPMYRVVGLTLLHDLLASPACRSVLVDEYGFDDRALHRLAGEANAFFLAQAPVVQTQPAQAQVAQTGEVPTASPGRIRRAISRAFTRCRAMAG